MKYLILIVGLSLLGAGCSVTTGPTATNPSMQKERNQFVEDPVKQDESMEAEEEELFEKSEEREDSAEDDNQAIKKTDEKIIYKGYWFDVMVPASFTPSPSEPLNYHEGVEMVLTDQAWFTSPDNEVEFYVYSPLWFGAPDYFNAQVGEELVDESKSDRKASVYTDQDFFLYTTTYRTFTANDGSYTRSIVLHQRDWVDNDGGLQSTENHVFGIKYSSQDAYDRYRDDYVAFKDSLQKYAD